jgi:hypothetical protein
VLRIEILLVSCLTRIILLMVACVWFVLDLPTIHLHIYLDLGASRNSRPRDLVGRPPLRRLPLPTASGCSKWTKGHDVYRASLYIYIPWLARRFFFC